MRDGVKLFTAVYVPKDATVTHPILLQRTPYSVAPYGVDQYRDEPRAVARLRRLRVHRGLPGRPGVLPVRRAVRGRPPADPAKAQPADIDESSDTFDTIDWLVKHIPDNNGRVGTWGISYPGFYAAASLIDAHPALKAVSPQAPLVDWFLGDDVHHNGALFLQQEFNFDITFGLARPAPTTKSNPRFDHGTPDAYDFFLKLGPLARANELYMHNERKFWNEVMRHDTYDAFWQARALLPHVKDVKPAVLTVGGWFDAEDLYGPLNTYQDRPPPRPGRATPSSWDRGSTAAGRGAMARRWARSRSRARRLSSFATRSSSPSSSTTSSRKPPPPPPAAWIFATGRNEWHQT